MNETDLIEAIQTYLSDEFDAAVRTSGMDDDRPMPAIILDDWGTEDITFHNSPLAGERYYTDDDGTDQVERIYRFQYETRIEFVVRHYDDVKSSVLKDTLKSVFRDLRLDPCQLHEHVNWVRPLTSDDPTYHFGAPKETELHVAALIGGFHQLKRTTDPDGGQDDGSDRVTTPSEWQQIAEIQNEFTVME